MLHAITASAAGATTARHPVTAAAVGMCLVALTWVALRITQGARLLGAPNHEGLR